MCVKRGWERVGKWGNERWMMCSEGYALGHARSEKKGGKRCAIERGCKEVRVTAMGEWRENGEQEHDGYSVSQH